MRICGVKKAGWGIGRGEGGMSAAYSPNEEKAQSFRMSAEHARIHTQCVLGHLLTRGEIRSMCVWPLAHQRRNSLSVCLATYSPEEKFAQCLFGHLLTRGEMCSVSVWPFTHQRRNSLSVCLAPCSPEEKFAQCLFGHLLTRGEIRTVSVWPLTHQRRNSLSVCLAIYSLEEK